MKTAPYSDNHGLIFRSFEYLFQRIQEQSDTHFVLKASYLEIYNEKVSQYIQIYITELTKRCLRNEALRLTTALNITEIVKYCEN